MHSSAMRIVVLASVIINARRGDKRRAVESQTCVAHGNTECGSRQVSRSSSTGHAGDGEAAVSCEHGTAIHARADEPAFLPADEPAFLPEKERNDRCVITSSQTGNTALAGRFGQALRQRAPGAMHARARRRVQARKKAMGRASTKPTRGLLSRGLFVRRERDLCDQRACARGEDESDGARESQRAGRAVFARAHRAGGGGQRKGSHPRQMLRESLAREGGGCASGRKGVWQERGTRCGQWAARQARSTPAHAGGRRGRGRAPLACVSLARPLDLAQNRETTQLN